MWWCEREVWCWEEEWGVGKGARVVFLDENEKVNNCMDKWYVILIKGGFCGCEYLYG